MADWNSWLDDGVTKTALAGLAGAAVNAVFEWKSWSEGIRKLFVGAVTAFFMAPVLEPPLQAIVLRAEIPLENTHYVGGFLSGVLGVFIIETIKVAAHRYRNRIRPEISDGQDNA